MRPIEHIKSRLKGTIAQEGEDGLRGVFSTGGKSFRYVFSYGGGWEHASISIIEQSRKKLRCPTWDEMCMFKEIFWSDDECVIQYHPTKSNYINAHKGCLHLWKPINCVLPKPPVNFV